MMRACLLLTVLSLCAAPLAAQCESKPDWERVIRVHVERYPAMDVDDLYKLLHQGALGSEHAVENPDAARRWLERELATLGEGVAEPTVDTIAPEGRFVRVHLRPFLRSGGDAGALLDAFVRTANAPAASPLSLDCALESAVEMALEGELTWDPARLTARFNELRADGFPALHHSEAYAVAYRPAYRVIAAELLEVIVPGGSDDR